MLLIPVGAMAGDLTLHSGPERVHLLELYTSEGCSSCPPAEERVSGLQHDPGLWKAFVPVAFHVDYWDYLGWKDRFASATYTGRQQSYAAEWGGDSVYTPEFVLDGREYRGGGIPAVTEPGGDLTAGVDSSRTLSVKYEPAAASPPAKWRAYVAMLGMGLESDVRGGENGGRRLRHDFVALSLQTLELKGAENSGSLELPPLKDGEKAIAVWVTRGDESTPVQAAGGWIR